MTPAGHEHTYAGLAQALGGRAVTLSARGLEFEGYELLPPGAESLADCTKLPVVILHGWPGFAGTWRQAAVTLSRQGHPVLAYDMRGVSPAARTGDVREYTGHNLGDDLVAIADAHGYGRFHLLAHSWGAWVGWHATSDHPDRFASFVSLATPHPQATYTAAAMSSQQGRLLAPFRRVLRDPAAARTKLLRNDAAVLRGFYDGRTPPALVDEDVARYLDGDTLETSMRLHAALAIIDQDDEWVCEVPTLYFWGSEDRFFSRLAFGLTGDYVTADYKPVEVAGATQWVGIDAHAFVMKTTLEWFAAHET